MENTTSCPIFYDFDFKLSGRGDGFPFKIEEEVRQIENTNFQNLKELLKNYTPKTSGVATAEECSLIKDSLQLERMKILDLRNLRDFVVLFFSRKSEDKLDMADIDRMSAITAVIDSEIIKRGGEV